MTDQSDLKRIPLRDISQDIVDGFLAVLRRTTNNEISSFKQLATSLINRLELPENEGHLVISHDELNDFANFCRHHAQNESHHDAWCMRPIWSTFDGWGKFNLLGSSEKREKIQELLGKKAFAIMALSPWERLEMAQK